MKTRIAIKAHLLLQKYNPPQSTLQNSDNVNLSKEKTKKLMM